MRIRDWIDRLGAVLDANVSGAADLAAAQEDQKRDTVYVMYADDRATPGDLISVVRQECHTGISVVMAITNRRDRRGEKGIDEIEVMRKAVMQSLVGWHPPETSGPVIFRRGRLVRMTNRTLWWQDEYEVPMLLSAAV